VYIYVGPPTINYITDSRTKFEGENVALTCRATYSLVGGLTIKWYHNGIEINSTDRVRINDTTNQVTGQVRSELDFHPLSRTDDGVYRCSAYSHLKCIDEKETNLTVECKLFIIQVFIYSALTTNIILLIDKPKVRITGISPSQQVYVGDEVSITCEAIEGKPVPTVQWYEDGLPVGSRSDAAIKTLDVPTNYTHTTTYKCVGTSYSAGNIPHIHESNTTIEVKGIAN